MLDRIGECWATFFYVGRIPKAPGSFGSLAALPFAWLLWQAPPPLAWALVALLFLSGTWAASAVHRRTGQSDHQSIVIDEVLGICLSCAAAAPVWWQYLAALLLFRLFDIWKPWPVRWFDRNWHSPLGTMLDDACAAGYAALGVWLAGRFG